jgi:hypothetical protein
MSANQQTVVFADPDKYDTSGNPYTFRVVQQAVPRYFTHISDYTITNSLIR